MPDRCTFCWSAPFFHPPPSHKVTGMGQECSLPEGHDGEHRSLSNVTHPSDGSTNPLWPTWDRRKSRHYA